MFFIPIEETKQIVGQCRTCYSTSQPRLRMLTAAASKSKVFLLPWPSQDYPICFRSKKEGSQSWDREETISRATQKASDLKWHTSLPHHFSAHMPVVQLATGQPGSLLHMSPAKEREKVKPQTPTDSMTARHSPGGREGKQEQFCPNSLQNNSIKTLYSQVIPHLLQI